MLNVQNINNTFYPAKNITVRKHNQQPGNINKSCMFQTYPAVYFMGNLTSKIERPQTNEETSKMLNKVFDKYHKELEETDLFAINNTVNELVNSTDFSKTEILDGMQVLTQFGNMRSIAKIGQTLEKYDVENILNSDTLLNLSAYNQPYEKFLKNNFGLNSSLDYLISKKDNYSLDGTKSAIFLDNNTIDNFEIYNKEYPKEFNKLINHKNIKFFLVSGLEDGISFLNRNKNLKDETLKLLENAKKKGLSPREYIDNAKLVRIKALGIKPIIINNEKAATPQNIYNQLRPEQMTKKELNVLIDAAILTSQYTDTKEETQKKEELTKYLKDRLNVYTPERISKELKNIHNGICDTVTKLGKSMEDVIYLIPEIGKSYDMIGYQYQLINNIPKEKFVTIESPHKFNRLNTKDKVLVILDDCSLSGTSLIEGENFIYSKAALMANDKNSNIIFAPLLISEYANNRINKNINSWSRKNKDCVVTTNVITDGTSNNLRGLIGESGWYQHKNDSFCVIFPYMCPDNNSEFAANIGLMHNISYRKASNNSVYGENIKSYLSRAKEIEQKTEELLKQESINN